MTCPLCRSLSHPYFALEKQSRFFHICPNCCLVFQENLPAEKEEKARYDLHRNDGEDPGYLSWLTRFIERGIAPWYEGGDILDFGSGPEPVLTELLRTRGWQVVPYDKYFAPQWPREGAFGMIVLSEVLEHLADPVGELKRICTLASENALLTLQTSFIKSTNPSWFSSWWYKEDLTHIRFYSVSSLDALGRKSGWKLIYQDGLSLACFRKDTTPDC